MGSSLSTDLIYILKIVIWKQEYLIEVSQKHLMYEKKLHFTMIQIEYF